MSQVRFEAKLLTRGAYRTFARVRNLGEDPTPLLDIIGGVLEASVRARFDSGRGPSGVPWPLSKRVEKHGGKTLVDKGNLERALRYEVQGRTRVLIGFDGVGQSVKAAAAHQFGVHKLVPVVAHFRTIDSAFGVPLPRPVRAKVRGHVRMMNLPARPMLGIDNNDRRDIESGSLDYLRSLFT